MLPTARRWQIMEAGTHDELLRNVDGPYSKLVHRQLSKAANECTDSAFDALDETKENA